MSRMATWTLAAVLAIAPAALAEPSSTPGVQKPAMPSAEKPTIPTTAPKPPAVPEAQRPVARAARVTAKSALKPQSASPPPADIKLLDEAPNYAKALADQWTSRDIPSGYRGAETRTTHYGLLRETAPMESLTLQQAIALALDHNTQLKIQRLGPLSARAAVRSAQAIFDPALFGDASYSRSQAPSTSYHQCLDPTDPNCAGVQGIFGPPLSISTNIEVDGGIRKMLLTGGQISLEWQNNRVVSNSAFTSLSPQYTTNFTLSLNQPLLRNFGWRFSTLLVRVARNSQKASTYQYEAIVAETVKQVESAYWGLVQAIENVDVQEQGLALANEVLRQNEGKYKVGALPQTSVLEAKTEVARQQAALITAKNAEIISRDNLRAIINYKAKGTNSLIMIRPADRPVVVRRDFDLEKSLATALEDRPELIAAKLDVHGKGMLLKVAENQLLPQLDATGSIGTNGLSGGRLEKQTLGVTTINPYNGPYSDALTRGIDGRYYSYSAGLSISIPLGNAQAKADYAQAQIDAETSKRNLDQEQETVTLEVKKAVTNLESDLKSIDATRIARELAEENVRNQKARYDVGLATTKDLLDFQNQLTQAKAAEVQALTNYSVDLAELERAQGTLLESRNIVVEHGEEEPTPWWAQF